MFFELETLAALDLQIGIGIYRLMNLGGERVVLSIWKKVDSKRLEVNRHIFDWLSLMIFFEGLFVGHFFIRGQFIDGWFWSILLLRCIECIV